MMMIVNVKLAGQSSDRLRDCVSCTEKFSFHEGVGRAFDCIVFVTINKHWGLAASARTLVVCKMHQRSFKLFNSFA